MGHGSRAAQGIVGGKATGGGCPGHEEGRRDWVSGSFYREDGGRP